MGRHDRLRISSLVSAWALIVVALGIAAGCASGESTRADDAATGSVQATSTAGSDESQDETTETGDAPPETGNRDGTPKTGETGGVAADAVAVLDGAPILRSELESWLAQQRRQFEAQGKTFPAEGSSEHQALVNKTLVALVHRKALALEARKQGVKVTRDEIDRRIDEIVHQQYDGSEQRYEESLRLSGATDAQAREEIRYQLLHAKLARRATADVTVSEAEIRAAYRANTAQFTQKRHREIALILVTTRDEAESALHELERGASFASVAKRVSRANTVRYTDTEGDFPAELEQVAFSLPTGETSEPVRVGSLWYIVKAVDDLVPEKTRPYREVRKQLRRQLLDEKRGGDAAWFAKLMKRYEKKLRFAPGFYP
jgi:parvulin-like peptidyl-prolyl isomerase